MTRTQTLSHLAEIETLLETAGWRRSWPTCSNSWRDEHDQAISVHYGSDEVRVEVESALVTNVEILNLSPDSSPSRIARIALAACDPED